MEETFYGVGREEPSKDLAFNSTSRDPERPRGSPWTTDRVWEILAFGLIGALELGFFSFSPTAVQEESLNTNPTFPPIPLKK